MRSWVMIVLLSSVVVSGCGGQEDRWKKARPKVVKASATVLYNGAPVEGAQIYFSAKEGSTGSIAETDKSGKALLTTFEKGDGLVPGSHSVKVSKELVETTIGKEKLPDSDDYPVTVKRVSVLPAKYGDYKTSKLTAEVSEQGPNDFVFELSDK